jgi:pectate lyase
MDADVLVEGNYFSGVGDPTQVGYADSGPGDLVERNNIYSNCGSAPQTQGSVAAIPYSYSPDNASVIPSLVPDNAGVGKISL